MSTQTDFDSLVSQLNQYYSFIDSLNDEQRFAARRTAWYAIGPKANVPRSERLARFRGELGHPLYQDGLTEAQRDMVEDGATAVRILESYHLLSREYELVRSVYEQNKLSFEGNLP